MKNQYLKASTLPDRQRLSASGRMSLCCETLVPVLLILLLTGVHEFAAAGDQRIESPSPVSRPGFEAYVGHDLGEHWPSHRISRLIEELPGLMLQYSVPGFAVALVTDDAIQWSGGFGVEKSGGSQVNPNTIFQAASLGKPVFAQIILSMEAESHWSRKISIHSLIPNVEIDPVIGGLTLDELLSHSAGLEHDDNAEGFFVDPDVRGYWKYSGAGYVLMQQVLERFSKETIGSLVRRHIFKPAGMNRSSFIRPQAVAIASAHNRQGNVLKSLDWESPNVASSMYTTAEDYARFLIHVLKQSTLSNSASAFFQPLVNLDNHPGLSWGPGWGLERSAGCLREAFHWGSNPGFKSFALISPRRGLGLVMLTNGDHGLELIEEAVEILDPIKHPLFDFHMLHPDD